MTKDAVPISERPAKAEGRAVRGHWEVDLLAGSGNTYIPTLVERRSRFTSPVKVGSEETATVVKALKRPVRTLMWDRGTEKAAHGAFKIATDVKVYVCDPRSPWQHGTNENTNGLLPQ